MATAHDEAQPAGSGGWRAFAGRAMRRVEHWMSGADAEGPPPDEAGLLRERRRAIQGTPGAPLEPAPAGERFDGLALSGGGIRSATFSLGVLQALAETARVRVEPGASKPPASFKASMLARFDYLSTVSGGGFIGAFLVGLFVPGRLLGDKTPQEKQAKAQDTAESAANRAQAVLGSGPPQRIRSDALGKEKPPLHAPLAWLRENGRYLAPTGSGDFVYAAGLGLRNWVSLHVVIGVALLLALTLLAALRGLVLGRARSGVPELESWLLDHALHGLAQLSDAAAACTSKCAAPSLTGVIWWSSLFPLAVVPLLLWVVPTGVAFWTTSRRPDGRSRAVRNRSVLGMTLAGAILAGMAWCSAAGPQPLWWVWLGLAGLTWLGVLVHVALAFYEPNARKQAVLLTRWLGAGLVATGVLLLLGVVETLGHTLYLLTISAITGASWLPSVPAALGAALAWAGKKVGAAGKGSALPDWMQKLPLTTLGGFVGLAVLLLIATVWAWVAQWLVWQGQAPSVGVMSEAAHLQRLWAQAAAWFLLAAGVGQFPAFINLSSLQSFYAARLIRTYLGASNAERFDGNPANLSAAEPLAGDNLPLDRLYAGRKLQTWAPLHLVNVTLNKTIDPAEQLVQRDRKGQPMAVMPYGFSIDGWRNLFRPASGNFPLNPTMHLGDWIGTSGAAFSTGIGRETTLGMSLLMGAANVRLGVWWASGVHEQKAPALWKLHAWAGRALGVLFRTQTYLGYEFTARFYGLRRRWQYLSDGGHFENTALYELLRRERRVGFILASDNGADPDYRFDDLANLIRLARIDLRTEVSVVTDFGTSTLLPGVFGATTAFSAGGDKANPAALLLKAQSLDDAAAPPCWIVLLKPSKQLGAPADVLQYAKTHPAFPQEPTADQFFDEAQWESYRSLGQHIAGRVLDARVWAALEAFMASSTGVSPSP